METPMTADNQKITLTDQGMLDVPDRPAIPFIEGDGTGPDIWRATRIVLDAAVAKALLSKHQLSPRDPHALNALIIAAMRGHSAVVELLLRGGLDADALDGNGLSARSAARIEGGPDVLELIDRVASLKVAAGHEIT